MRRLLWYWYDVRCWLETRPDVWAWWLAWKLPRKVALYAFVRVYGVLGDCGPDYEYAYKAWEAGRGR